MPALTGLGSPHFDPEARGAIMGLTRGTTRAHLARAALEAMAYQTVDAVRAMEHAAGLALNELHADGGAVAAAMVQLIARLRPLYDRIVLDTPPAGAIADALALSRLVDGVLVVARSGKVARGELLHVLDRLANAGAPLWGVVLNRVRPDRHPDDYGPDFLPASLGREGRRPLALGPPRTERDPGGRFH